MNACIIITRIDVDSIAVDLLLLSLGSQSFLLIGGAQRFSVFHAYKPQIQSFPPYRKLQGENIFSGVSIKPQLQSTHFILKVATFFLFRFFLQKLLTQTSITVL